MVDMHGPKNWKKIAELLGDTRTDVQCLHRWNKVLKVSKPRNTCTDVTMLRESM